MCDDIGCFEGAVLAAIQPRIHWAVFFGGGDPILPIRNEGSPLGKEGYEIAPSLFVGHIAPGAIFMGNALNDTVMPRAATDRMYAAAQDPKKIEFYRCGHDMPVAAEARGIRWLGERLQEKS